jgi:Flp pilus assembly protein TadD
MRQRRDLVAALVSLALLTGCGSSSKVGEAIQSKPADEKLATGSTSPTTDDPTPDIPSGPLESGSNDDLNAGNQSYRSGDYATAQRYFRRATEAHPRDAEAWLGLAASYDQLRRFDLADRAYEKVVAIAGKTPELLNNRGYSYMLRGDYKRARTTLLQARAMDPANTYVQNNLDLLEKSTRKGKSAR